MTNILFHNLGTMPTEVIANILPHISSCERTRGIDEVAQTLFTFLLCYNRYSGNSFASGIEYGELVIGNLGRRFPIHNHLSTKTFREELDEPQAITTFMVRSIPVFPLSSGSFCGFIPMMKEKLQNVVQLNFEHFAELAETMPNEVQPFYFEKLAEIFQSNEIDEVFIPLEKFLKVGQIEKSHGDGALEHLLNDNLSRISRLMQCLGCIKSSKQIDIYLGTINLPLTRKIGLFGKSILTGEKLKQIIENNFEKDEVLRGRLTVHCVVQKVHKDSLYVRGRKAIQNIFS